MASQNAGILGIVSPNGKARGGGTRRIGKGGKGGKGGGGMSCMALAEWGEAEEAEQEEQEKSSGTSVEAHVHQSSASLHHSSFFTFFQFI